MQGLTVDDDNDHILHETLGGKKGGGGRTAATSGVMYLERTWWSLHIWDAIEMQHNLSLSHHRCHFSLEYTR